MFVHVENELVLGTVHHQTMGTVGSKRAECPVINQGQQLQTVSFIQTVCQSGLICTNKEGL